MKISKLMLSFSLIVCCVVINTSIKASTAYEVYGQLEISLDKNSDDFLPEAAVLHTEYGSVNIAIDEEKLSLCEEGEFVISEDIAGRDIFHIVNVNHCDK